MDPFEFYSQVYGIESFVAVATAPTVSAVAESHPALQPHPWIEFTSDLTTSEFKAYSEMFGKITAAMGLKANDFALCLRDSQQMLKGTQVSVAFGGAEQGWQVTNELPKKLVVPSLQDMAQNPELKKSAWSFLKQAMDRFGIDKGRAF